MNVVMQNVVKEWSFGSAKTYRDPFNEVTMDMVFTSEAGTTMVVPGFWAGGNVWKVRFSSHELGRYSYRTVCSDPDNPDLHDRRGEIEVIAYRGDNELLRRGPIRIASDHRHFEHADGSPFFWLADTWWMSLCGRLKWPRDFQTLTMDRVEKGFTVIQLVAGLYPDMYWYDDRGANEAGFPWDKEFTAINPAYFDYADRRIAYLVDSGLVPCLVGCWGFFLPLMGVEKMKQHWRYLVARYGAYPMFWCMAGEATMPFYMSKTRDQDAEIQKKGWTPLTAYVRGLDPFHRPLSVHPTWEGRDQVDDPSLLDYEMLQTGHSDRQSVPDTIKTVTKAVGRAPMMPVINSEVCYEGIGEACRQELQRFLFWTCMLNGAAGHTYGANGLWQVNTRQRPYGPSPHGLSWGKVTWDEAAGLPGSRQIGLSKKLLERYEWWRFESHREWVEPHWSEEDYFQPYAAGIPGRVRVIFWPRTFGSGVVTGIETDVRYRAFLFDPVDGEELDLGRVEPDDKGSWVLPTGNPPHKVMPMYQDWVLVLENPAK